MFNIKSIEDEKEAGMLKEFLLGQSQFYPQYDSWVDEKCMPRVESGEYQNLIVISDGKLIGDVVYKSGEKIDLKNFRIDSQYRQRDLGHFLMSQVEHLNQGKNLKLDVTSNNFLGVEFFIRNGFSIKGIEDLYKKGQNEYLMEKPARTPKNL